MATCTTCRFWRGPPPLDPEKEAIALSHGVNRDGGCHRYPRVEKTGGTHFCGEWEKKPA